MARAQRHYLPGQVWHITHRCHKREFLLKFAKDRRRWLQWLFEAKRRYGLVIMNYVVTYNPILSFLIAETAIYTPKTHGFGDLIQNCQQNKHGPTRI